MSDETIFANALEKPSPADRAAYLAEACAADPGQRNRLDALLAAHDRAGEFLAKPAVAAIEPEHAATRAFRDPAKPDDHGDTRTQGELTEDDRLDALAFLQPPGRPDSLGRVGQYEVLEVLGQGGFGIVFRAFDEKLQRVVAVKMLAPSIAATSPARKRFLREARSAAQVRHENVVQVFAVEEQPLPHLVMEFIPGESLQQRLDRIGPLDVPQVLTIGRRIAEGLAAAHATGLIHRDIKPSNILIDSGPHPQTKITDFGLARAADDASLTRSGTVAGTPMYMAPEQAKGESLDHRADLFSLGSVLYVMCTGRPPFRASGTLAVLKRVAEEDPRPIREIIPEVPEWLCRIVEKLHAKDPAERFQSAKEVADVLADCETQLADHKELKDFARIPEGKPVPTNVAPAQMWVVVALSLVAIIIVPIVASMIVRSVFPEFSHSSKATLLYSLFTLSLIAFIIRFWAGYFRARRRHAVLTAGTHPFAHAAVKDLSRIPEGKPQKSPQPGRWNFAAGLLGLLLAIGLVFGTLALFWYSLGLRDYFHKRDSAKATFLLTCDDPDTHFTLEGHGVSHTYYANDAALRSTEPLELSAGEYTLRAFRGKQQISEETFRLAAGGHKHLQYRPSTPSPNPASDSFVSLFNGKDLTGWKAHLTQPGNWRVEEGSLVGSGPEAVSHLFSDRDDYENFHLRVEARINFRGKTGLYFGNSGIYFRAGKDLTLYGRYPGGYEAQIFAGENTPLLPGREKNRTGSLYRLKPYEQIVPGADAGEWFTLEIIAVGPRITIKVNGVTTVDGFEDTTYRRGHLALQQVGAETAVQFRKIEIKELPPSSPEVPRRAADVLPFMAGTWRVERQDLDPKLPPDKALTVAEATNDFVADGKFLRSRGGSGYFIHSHDTGTNVLRQWHTHSSGYTTGPVAGLFNPDNRTVTWREQLGKGIELIHQFDFVDANTIKTRLFQQDASGTIARETRLTFTRIKGPVTIPTMPTDPQRPDEMKVLDRLVGEWSIDETVTTAAAPGKPEVNKSRQKAQLILAGRMVEMFETNETNNSNDYTLAWYDATAKQYCQWYFSGRGYVHEFAGTWNEIAKTMNWKSPDAGLFGHWTFKSDDQYEFQRAAKDWLGRTVFEAKGVSRRVASDWVPLFNGKDLTGWKTHPDFPGNWRVEDGVIVGTSGSDPVSHLYSERGDFQNFHLRAVAMIGQYGDGGIHFRCTPAPLFDMRKLGASAGGQPLGYEANIGNPHAKTGGSGSIWWLGPDAKRFHRAGNDVLTRPNTWFTLEVIAQGRHIVTKFDGKTVVDYHDEKTPVANGHLALSVNLKQTEVRFKTIEIKELPAPKPAAPPLAVAPFEAAKAKEHQESWAKHLGAEVETTNSIGMKLRLIPPGKFAMGSSQEAIDNLLIDAKDAEKFLIHAEGPNRTVELTAPFLMGRYEVTQAEYLRVMGTNPSDFASTGKQSAKVDGLKTDQFPVESISWFDAEEFCKKLSELPEERAAGRTYRLPTEAEWEYACRAGTEKWFHTGEVLTDGEANIEVTLGRTREVGAYAPNAFGLCDMHGNVFEWCQDIFADTYRGLAVTDPKGPATGDNRIVRGGNYGYRARYCRSAARDRFQPTATRGGIGFRVVVTGNLKSEPAAIGKSDVVQPLRDAIAAKEQALKTVRQRFSADKASFLELITAEDDLIGARIKLAETQSDTLVVIWLLEELVKHRSDSRNLIAWRIDTGERLDPDVPKQADARLAEAKARLAKVKPRTTPEVAPEPRPKP